MRPFSLLLVFALAGVCLEAEQNPAPRAQGKEPTYKGKTLHEWIALVKEKGDGGLGSKWHAYEVLEKDIGPAAVPALTELLKDKDAYVRETAVFILGRIGPEAKATIPALTGLLKDGHEQVRLEAAWALGKISPTGPETKMAVSTLTALLKDGRNRRGAAWALGEMGAEAKTAVPVLVGSLKDMDGQVRCAAALALWRISPKGCEGKTAISVLTELLNDKEVRYAATDALAKIGPDARTAVPALIGLLRSWDSYLVPSAIGKIGPAAIPSLIKLLKDENARVRGAAALALGKIGPEAKAAIPALTELLNDKSSGYAAALALGEIRPEAKNAVRALGVVFSDNWMGNREVAIRALGCSGPAGVPALVELLKDKKQRLRREASVLLTSKIVKFLTKLSSGGGVKLLQRYVL